MKLITFTTEGHSRIGALVKGEQVVDLNYAYQAKLESEGKYRNNEIAKAYVPSKMVAFLEGGQESIAIANTAVDYTLSNDGTFAQKLYIKNRK